MRLPDSRYSANREFCGHETAMYIPRFCGEWLRDSILWPDRAGNQAPPAHTRQAAIAACVAYEENRQKLLQEATPDGDSFNTVLQQFREIDV